MKKQLRKITALLLVLSMLLGLTVTASADGDGPEQPHTTESENADISVFDTDTGVEEETASGEATVGTGETESGTGEEDDGVAWCFQLNGLPYGYDANLGKFVTYVEGETEPVDLPAGVSCTIVDDVLTMTLDGASLTSIWFDYKGTDTDEDGTVHPWQHLPSEKLTLVLAGDSTISKSLGFGDGIHVTVQGEGSLTVSGDGMSFETALTVTDGTLKVPSLLVFGTYTQTGGAVIADSTGSDDHMAFVVIGAFDECPAASAVISGGTLTLNGATEISGAMTIKDRGSVTVKETLADAEYGSRAVGLLGSLTVEGGSLTVENTGGEGTDTLALYVEGGTYTQTGGTVTLTSTRNVALEIDEVEGHVSAVTVSGGSLTANGGTCGCKLYNGTLALTGGTVNVTGSQYGLWVIGSGTVDLEGGSLNATGWRAVALISDETVDWLTNGDINGISIPVMTVTGGTHTFTGTDRTVESDGETKIYSGTGLYVAGGSTKITDGTLTLSGTLAAVQFEKLTDPDVGNDLTLDGMNAVSDETVLELIKTYEFTAYEGYDHPVKHTVYTYFEGNEPNEEKTNRATAVTICHAESSGGGENELGEYLAGFSVNGQWYEVHQGEGNATVIGYWVETDERDEEGNIIYRFVEEGLPTGVSYDYGANTMTLEDAKLTGLAFSYSGTDESTGDPWVNLPNANLTIKLVGNNTIIGDAENVVRFDNNVAATVTGDGILTVGWTEGYENTMNNSPFRWDDASLTVASGTLVVNGTVWSGGPYTQTGGSVTITGSRFQDNGWVGLNLNGEGATSTVSGGTLTVTANYTTEGDWAHALEVSNGHTLNITGGMVLVNGNEQALAVNGYNVWYDEENKEKVIDQPGTVNVSGGTLHVNGTAYVYGTLNIKGFGAVNVTVDAGQSETPDGPWVTGINADRHYYTDDEGNYSTELFHPATLNVEGGSLTVQLTGTYNRAPALWSNGAVSISGGTVTLTKTGALDDGAVWMGDGGQYTQSGGTVTLSDTRPVTFGTVTVSGGTLNIPGCWVNGKYIQSGGTVTVTGVYSHNMEESDPYWQGFGLGADSEISGGKLDITVKNGTAHTDGLGWDGELTVSGDAEINVTVDQGCGIVVNSNGTYTQTGGTVTVTNHSSENPEAFNINGCNVWHDDKNNEDVTDQPAVATVSGGTLHVNGRLNLNGTLNLSNTGAVNVTVDAGKENNDTWISAINADGHYYIDDQGNYDKDLSSPAKLNVEGGSLTVQLTGTYNNAPALWSSGGALNISGGTVSLTKTGVQDHGAVTLNDGSTYTQTGGTVTVTSSSSENPVALTIDGANAWAVGDELHTEKAAVAAISGGTLHINGQLHLGGTLKIENTGAVDIKLDDSRNTWYETRTDDEGNESQVLTGGWYPGINVDGNSGAALNISGGSLTVDVTSNTAATAPAMYTNGTVVISGGTVSLTQHQENCTALEIADSFTVSGGKLTAGGTDTGALLITDDTHVGKLTVLGGQVDLLGTLRGLHVSGGYEKDGDGPTVTLAGGQLTAVGRDRGANIYSGFWIDDPGDAHEGYITDATVSHLIVSGGEHTFAATGDGSIGLFINADIEVTGGTLHLSGANAFFYDSIRNMFSEDGNTWYTFTLGETMHAVSDTTGRELELAEKKGEQWNNSDVYYYSYHEDNGDYATAVTISSTAGTKTVNYAASMDIQSSNITAGAPVTLVYNVAGTGTVSFTLPEGVKLMSGSVSVNGKAYTDSLTNIPVTGAATIAFRVVPEKAETYEIKATFTLLDGSDKVEKTETVSFTARDFQITLPTYTSSRIVRVTGLGTPGKTVTVTLTNEEKSLTVTNTATVTELGTFAMKLDLPNTISAKTVFTVTVTQGEQTYEPGTLIYAPNIPQVKWAEITNTVHGANLSTTVEETVYIDFSEGYGKPDRSFYTYWPNLREFDFAVELEDNTGVIGVCVAVYYQDGTCEEIKLDLDTDGVWRSSAVLSGPPTGYQIIIVYDSDPTPTPSPEDPTPSPAPGGGEEDDDDNNTVIIIKTEIIPVTPIMDPSGTVYSGTEEAPGVPVSGATVTLYYSKDKPDDSTKGEVFDMSDFGQVNSMITGLTGHYHWDVPTGWWKIVAEYDGHTAESQWMEVLPVRTGVDLYLGISGLKATLTGSTVSAQLSELLKLDEDSRVFCAFYDADGRMVDIQSAAAVAKEDITFTTEATFATAKVFAVSGTMEPLCGAVTVSQK